MTEIDRIINSCPLVAVTIDAQNDEPLTSNHLLLLRGNSNLHPGIFTKQHCYAKQRRAQVQYLSNALWNRWIKEFFPTITLRQKWFQTYSNIEKGSLVLLVEDIVRRSEWSLCHVVDTFSDCRERIQTVRVKVNNGIMKRPITKLCVICNLSVLTSQTSKHDSITDSHPTIVKCLLPVAILCGGMFRRLSI